MEVIVKVITYSLIYLVIGVVMKKIKDSQVNRVIPEDCLDYFDMKVQSKILLWGGVFFAVLTLVCVVAGGGAASYIFLGFAVFAFSFCILLGLWYVAIKEDGIEMQSNFGRKSIVKYEEITKASFDKNNNLCIYKGEKMIIFLEKEYDFGKTVEILKDRGVNVM